MTRGKCKECGKAIPYHSTSFELDTNTSGSPTVRDWSFCHESCLLEWLVSHREAVVLGSTFPGRVEWLFARGGS